MNVKLLLALLYDGVLLGVTAYALLRGGRPERLGALLNIAGSAATIALRWLSIATGAPAEIVIMTIDAGVLAGFFWLATRSTRFWPIWAFGLALADIVMSVAGALMPTTPLFAYHTGLGIYAYLALGALAVGTSRLPRDATDDQRWGFSRSWPPLTKN